MSSKEDHKQWLLCSQVSKKISSLDDVSWVQWGGGVPKEEELAVPSCSHSSM